VSLAWADVCRQQHGRFYIDGFFANRAISIIRQNIEQQEGTAVASIARDDPSTLSGDDPFIALACTATTMRGKFGSEFEPMSLPGSMALHHIHVT